MKLAITEWNQTAADWGEPRAHLQTLANGLFCARMFNHFQRNGDLVRIANRSNLVNSCFSGSIQTTGLDLYCTPTYYVQKLYATMSGSVALAADTDKEFLDISATADPDYTRCMIWIINPAEQDCGCTLDLKEINNIGTARKITLTGPNPDAVNSIARKDQIIPIEEQLPTGQNLQTILPPWSLTGIEISC
jgi:alpha-L-arabinofuranosidase